MSENEIYFGQLDPKWRQNAQKIIDEQKAEMLRLEKEANINETPKEYLYLGAGVLILLLGLVIYKYK